jgi:tyrosyl-tRNA synthetase
MGPTYLPLALTFDDVLLEPRKADISRSEVSLRAQVTKKIWINIPILSAAMDTVTESAMAIVLGKLGGLGVLHRNSSIAFQITELRKVKKTKLIAAGAVGPADLERAIALDKAGADIIVVDTAHAHNTRAIKSAREIKKKIKAQLIVGNIATREAAVELAKFADGIKVGIGPGSICTTRIIAGIGIPQLTAIMNVVAVAKKYKLRPVIPIEEIKKNAASFVKQAMMVLHDDPETHEIRYNSEWLGKLSAKDLLELMSTVTLEKLMSRDMFKKRQAEGKEIYSHELVYPILQGYDSVALKADLVVIGSDQLFNEMMGRELEAKFNLPPQVVLTTKITPGTDGKEKQSKSLGNYIGLNHSPREKFGRIMSIPDNLIAEYFRVYTTVPLEDISKMESTVGKTDPMKFKTELAKAIVARYYGEKAAQAEAEWFQKTFSEKTMPEDIPVVKIGGGSANILEVLTKCFGSAKSKTELRKLIQDRAVSVDGAAVSDAKANIKLPAKIKVGKRNWFNVK